MDWKLGALAALILPATLHGAEKELRPACLDAQGKEVMVYGSRTENLCRQVGARLGTVEYEPAPLSPELQELLSRGPDPANPVELHRKNCYKRGSYLIAAGTVLSRVDRATQWRVEVTFVEAGRVLEVTATRVATGPTGSANFEVIGPGEGRGSDCEFSVREILPPQ